LKWTILRKKKTGRWDGFGKREGGVIKETQPYPLKPPKGKMEKGGSVAHQGLETQRVGEVEFRGAPHLPKFRNQGT